MRRWGIVISAFYAVLVLALFWPAAIRLAGATWPQAYRETFLQWTPSAVLSWILPALLIAGEALLVFMTVDASGARVKPRQRIWISALVVGFFTAVLSVGLILSVWAAVGGDRVGDDALSPARGNLSWNIWILSLWALWGGAFYAYSRGAPIRVANAVSWLLSASVLELLVAVPAHVMVRRKDECSAPMATGFGIASGIAVMLACFGPGVLALYRKRLERYRTARGRAPSLGGKRRAGAAE